MNSSTVLKPEYGLLDFEFHILQVFYKVNLVTKLEVVAECYKKRDEKFNNA